MVKGPADPTFDVHTQGSVFMRITVHTLGWNVMAFTLGGNVIAQ